MGGFLLYKSNHSTNLDAVETIFRKKGFSTGNSFRLSSWDLNLYAKQLVSSPNYVQRDNATGLFACGSPVYKGKSYRSTLEKLLADFVEDGIDYGALLGNYVLIFWAEGHIRILTDPLNVQHLFYNAGFNCISTSFLAVLCASEQPLAINRMAFYEKIAKGYILGPDTLVEDVYQWAPPLSRQPRDETLEIITPALNIHDARGAKNGFQDCLEQQVHCLDQYMEDADALCAEYGAELGLSSGYDSRLVFAASKALTRPLSLHTHWTEGVHDNEQAIVSQMAARRNTPLHVVCTRPMSAQTEAQFAQILEDGLYYYDGRCSHNMGAFSETYTREYKTKTLADNRVSLNGLGGEIYRNYYLTSRRHFDFRKWYYNHVFYVFTPFAFEKAKRLDAIYESILSKMEARLGLDLKGRVGLPEVRRYYSELRMPDCDGSNHNAHNQLAFFLTPFIEPKVIEVGYLATPHLGVSGRFQSALLQRVDPAVASVESHYGFPLSREPWKYKFKCAVKGYLPDSLEMGRKRMLVSKKGLGMQNLKMYKALLSCSQSLQSIDQALHDVFPEIDWHMCMRDYAQSATAIFLGSLLVTFHEYLKSGQ